MVYYIYHSAFVIELEKSILIFDFYKFPSNKKKEKEKFFNRFIKRTDKKVYVFSTHSHLDHFNNQHTLLVCFFILYDKIFKSLLSTI